MTPEETGRILGEIALCDNRKVDVPMVAQWHRMIGGLAYRDTSQAVVEYFAESTEYLKPADLIRRVKAIRERRITAAPIDAPPAEPGPYVEQLRSTVRQLADGFRMPAAITSGTSKGPSADYERIRQEERCGKRYREAVARYPDLAERLTHPPLSYARPEQWNGFVPPKEFPEGTLNDSPRRAALVAIVDEALARDAERKAS